MVKQLCCFIFFGICFLNSFSQVSVSLHEPPAGIVQNSQLWNITLICAGNSPITVTIGLSLFDTRDNQPLLTASSKQITLSGGIRQLRMTDLGPIDYNYVSPGFNLNRLPESFLPIGNYRACYAIYGGSKESEGIIAEDCISIEVQPLSPPQLNLPADSGVVESPYPQFSWLPPAPLMLFNNLNYDLLVTEVFAGQTPEAAIQENLPVYFVPRITGMFNSYPASGKSLDTGRVYAWRIVAKNDEMFAAQTEVWTFMLSNKKNKLPVPTNGNYLTLKTNDIFTSTGIIPDRVLGLKYYSYDKTHDAEIKFLNEKGEVIKVARKKIQYGENYLVFELENRFNEEATYFVETTDAQLAKYSVSFRISK
jgi:hypothetical protein